MSRGENVPAYEDTAVAVVRAAGAMPPPVDGPSDMLAEMLADAVENPIRRPERAPWMRTPAE